jgi:hypothetical protein
MSVDKKDRERLITLFQIKHDKGLNATQTEEFLRLAELYFCGKAGESTK